jgi:hypothetical protein
VALVEIQAVRESPMTNFGILNYCERSTITRSIASIFLILASIVAGIVLVELLSYFFLPPLDGASVYHWNRRIMFFDGGETIFQNHGDIFTYVPNNEIRSLTVYFSDDGFAVEYDYRFHANNYGLVQDADIVPARPSLLLLGDSFDEGQGAEPWFRQMGPLIDQLEYQVINGGLIGTGFEQWRKLEQYLGAESLQIRKLIVLFISDDYARGVWNFSPPVLRCLSALYSCRGDESLYFRLPARQELSSWVDKIRAFRTPPPIAKYSLDQRARQLLPASYHAYDYLSSQNSKIRRANERAGQRSRAAIFDMIERYGTENVAFMHVPQKDEANGPNELGLMAQRAIREAGGKLFDGFKLCRLAATDYRTLDGHPNEVGYGKIARCVAPVIRQMATAAR